MCPLVLGVRFEGGDPLVGTTPIDTRLAKPRFRPFWVGEAGGVMAEVEEE